MGEELRFFFSSLLASCPFPILLGISVYIGTGTSPPPSNPSLLGFLFPVLGEKNPKTGWSQNIVPIRPKHFTGSSIDCLGGRHSAAAYHSCGCCLLLLLCQSGAEPSRKKSTDWLDQTRPRSRLFDDAAVASCCRPTVVSRDRKRVTWLARSNSLHKPPRKSSLGLSFATFMYQQTLESGPRSIDWGVASPLQGSLWLAHIHDDSL